MGVKRRGVNTYLVWAHQTTSAEAHAEGLAEQILSMFDSDELESMFDADEEDFKNKVGRWRGLFGGGYVWCGRAGSMSRTR